MKKNKKRIDTILASLENGSSQVDACKAAGTTYVTFFSWQRTDKKLKARVEEVLDSRVLVVEDVCYKRLIMGTASPAEYIFYLKNRAPERWKDTYDTAMPSNTINVFMKNIFDKAGLNERQQTEENNSSDTKSKNRFN